MPRNWALKNFFFAILLLLKIVPQLQVAQVEGMRSSSSSSLLKFFSPCTFPIPPTSVPTVWQPDNDERFRQETEFIDMCHIHSHQTYFLCDLHDQLKHQNPYTIKASFAKHHSVLQQNGTYMIGILMVKHLAQPVSSTYITKTSPEFGCLFQLPCEPMTAETAEKYVKSVKTFTKIYTAALFQRWFSIKECLEPRVMVLIVLDGIISDTRKLTSVILYTDNRHFTPYISNIQLETTNYLLQGGALPDVVADMIDNLGHAFQEFARTKGRPRRHPIPDWAWRLAGICAFLMLTALFVEWFIVRKRLSRRRPVCGVPSDTVRKTHMMF